MENLEQYRRRTGGFMRDSLPRDGMFETNPNLTRKVEGGGGFRPFYGDTVIFDVEDEVNGLFTLDWQYKADAEEMRALNAALYAAFGDLFSKG